MREFDSALKKALTEKQARWFRRLTGCESLRWINVELHKSGRLRADLLGLAPDGRIFHFELQSANDPAIWLRMLEYALAIYRRYGVWPVQFVIYVGPDPMQMKGVAEQQDLRFRFNTLDIRTLETEPFLASPSLGDNVLAILTSLGEIRQTVRRILKRVSRGSQVARREAVEELLVIAGLRRVNEIITEEAEQMPLLNDLIDHPYFGPKLREARRAGEVKGEKKGEVTGLRKGQVDLFLRQTEHRFGSIRQPYASGSIH